MLGYKQLMTINASTILNLGVIRMAPTFRPVKRFMVSKLELEKARTLLLHLPMISNNYTYAKDWTLSQNLWPGHSSEGISVELTMSASLAILQTSTSRGSLEEDLNHESEGNHSNTSSTKRTTNLASAITNHQPPNYLKGALLDQKPPIWLSTHQPSPNHHQPTTNSQQPPTINHQPA